MSRRDTVEIRHSQIHVPNTEQDAITAVVQEREAMAAAVLENSATEAALRDMAEILGYDFNFVRSLALTDAVALAELYAHKSRERETAHRNNPSEIVNLGRTEDLAKTVKGKTPDQIKAIARAMIPHDMRQTHMTLFDPPMEDGRVYSFSFIKNADVPKKIEAGWSVVPRGQMADDPAMACGMPNKVGIACDKKFRTFQDVMEHQRAKHLSAYQAMVEQRTRDREEQRHQEDSAKMDALMEVVRQQSELMRTLLLRGDITFGGQNTTDSKENDHGKG